MFLLEGIEQGNARTVLADRLKGQVSQKPDEKRATAVIITGSVIHPLA